MISVTLMVMGGAVSRVSSWASKRVQVRVQVRAQVMISRRGLVNNQIRSRMATSPSFPAKAALSAGETVCSPKLAPTPDRSRNAKTTPNPDRQQTRSAWFQMS